MTNSCDGSWIQPRSITASVERRQQSFANDRLSVNAAFLPSAASPSPLPFSNLFPGSQWTMHRRAQDTGAMQR